MKSAAFEQFTRLEREHWWFRGRRAVYLQLLEDALGGSRPRRILDVGSGVGGFLPELAQLGEQLLFTEFDAQATRIAAGRNAARGLQARAEALPLARNCVDLACLFDVIEHVEDDVQALREARRVLAPGGKLILSVPAHAWLYSRNDEVAGHVRRYSRSELIRKVDASGLQLLRCTSTNSLLFPGIAGVVLASKLAEHTIPGLKRSEHTNLSWKVPRVAHELLYRMFRSELHLSRHWDLPFGHSLLLIAEKRVAGATPVRVSSVRKKGSRERRVTPQAVSG